MTRIHLVSHHLCPYVQRAVIVLTEKGIAHRRTYIDLANKPDWFLRLSPTGRVPVLETQGRVLFESQVIAEYLDEITPGTLHPADPLEKARHRAWIEFASGTLDAIGRFYNAPDPVSFASASEALTGRFARVAPEIAGPFFDGNRFHMIDGVWGTVFRYLDVFDDIGEFGLLDGLDGVQRWRAAIATRPAVANAAPDDYSERLRTGIAARRSHLSERLTAPA